MAMALFNLKDLLASLGPNQRVIGIDPGSKVIGLALSDVGRTDVVDRAAAAWMLQAALDAGTAPDGDTR
jgi:RNase H-fold protein (predicted Holliday junction resolvase)